MNIALAQAATSINAILGDGGATQFPSGLDVAGATVSGLGTPQGETDAVSSGHVESNYGAATQSQNLDLGGSHTLKGLSGLWLMIGQAGSGTVPLAKLTSGGTEGSITFLNGFYQSSVAPT